MKSTNDSANPKEDSIKLAEDNVILPEDSDQQINDNTTTPDDIIKLMKDIIKTGKLLLWPVKDNNEGVNDSINSSCDIINCPNNSKTGRFDNSKELSNLYTERRIRFSHKT